MVGRVLVARSVPVDAPCSWPSSDLRKLLGDLLLVGDISGILVR